MAAERRGERGIGEFPKLILVHGGDFSGGGLFVVEPMVCRARDITVTDPTFTGCVRPQAAGSTEAAAAEPVMFGVSPCALAKSYTSSGTTYGAR